MKLTKETIKSASKDEIQTLINKLHYGENHSIRKIERDLGLGKTTLNGVCKRHKIKLKSKIESIKQCQHHINRPSGEAHWSKTQPEVAARVAAASSKRMRENNPSQREDVRMKMSHSQSIYFKKNPTHHEKLFIEFLDSHNVSYKFQPVIGTYMPDFVFDNVIVELDGRGHASRVASDLKRDKSLCAMGFHVIRICQDSIYRRGVIETVNFRKLIQVMEYYIPNLDVFSSLPTSLSCKHRVIVRESGDCTEIVY